jgi:tRNA(adenine34) deaminase
MGAGAVRLQKRGSVFKPRACAYQLSALGLTALTVRAGRGGCDNLFVVSMQFTADDQHFMRESLAFARIAFGEQEVPIGAVVVRDGKMIGRGRNRREALADPTHHAEIEAIREAAQAVGNWRLEAATLYATVEPCAMCAGAAVNARIARIVFGCADPKAGYCGTLGDIPQDPRLNHRCRVDGGLLADESAELLRLFFQARR